MLKAPGNSENDYVDVQATARAASLIYCNDTEPGIRRRRVGKGFWYVATDGSRLDDGETLTRIRSLAIPPAWTDVWISPHEDGHIQATGRDARGRKQYRYHARWTIYRDEVKFSNLVAFARALPKLRQQVDSDLRRHGVPRERILAAVVWLLDRAMIRIGNPSYARDNNSFGLTTLREQHVELEGSTLRLQFSGKSGKEWNLKITDRRIARVIRALQDLPDQRLFQYLDADGQRHSVASQDVNDYIREAGGPAFSSKHFRTWGGTVRAAGLFAGTEVPATKGEHARVMNSIIDQVAAKLGNTRTVCRQCYIHPAVIAAWSDGRLSPELGEIRRRMRKIPQDLHEEEAMVLRWLERLENDPV
ncbi:DNA topoisomerase IB [Phyllobacterium salinisoli]|uniref:DNA topoisomerase n=1 Tax=Phyllobacterium salinisoli TaxID=1899321 RepID=A0A368K793_9HYPH|nr:DNA topoisomerase IB [Phyllobacterium salinisoli]RCS25247.1 DNA topoisomerase IB [Phyllobacterium salinisoli]